MCARRAKVDVSEDSDVSYDKVSTNAADMGLYLAGRIADRSRRYVPKDNPTTEIVTYTVEYNGDHRYYVDDFAPQGVYYEVGTYVKWSVYIKPYVKKNKEASYTLGIQKNVTISRGERF